MLELSSVTAAVLQESNIALIMTALPALPTPAAECPTFILMLARPVLETTTLNALASQIKK